MLQNLQLQIQKNAAQYDNPLIKERALMAEGQIKSEQEKLAAEFGLKTDHLILNEMQAKQKIGQENQKLVVGNYGIARTEREAIDARNTLSAGAKFIRKMDDLIKLREKYGAKVFPSEAKNEMESLHAQLLSDYKDIHKLGTLDTGVLKLFDKIAKSPTAFGYRVEQYKALRDQALKDMEADIRSKLVGSQNYISNSTTTAGGKNWKELQ